MLHFSTGPITSNTISTLSGDTLFKKCILLLPGTDIIKHDNSSAIVAFPTHVVKNPESDKRVQAAIRQLGYLIGEDEFDFVLPICQKNEGSSNPSLFDSEERDTIPSALQKLCGMQINFSKEGGASLDLQLADYYKKLFRLLAYGPYEEKNNESEKTFVTLVQKNLATCYPTFIKGFKEGQRDKEKKKQQKSTVILSVSQSTGSLTKKTSFLGGLWGWIKKKWNGLKDKVRGRNAGANRDATHVNVARIDSINSFINAWEFLKVASNPNAPNNTELLKEAHASTLQYFESLGNPLDGTSTQKLDKYIGLLNSLLNKYPELKTTFSAGEKTHKGSQWVKVYDFYVNVGNQDSANLIRNHFCSADEQGQIKDAELAESAIDTLILTLNSETLINLNSAIIQQMNLGFSSAPYCDVMSKANGILSQQQAFLHFIRHKCKDKGKTTELKRLFEAEVNKVNERIWEDKITPSTLMLLDNLRILQLQPFIAKTPAYAALKKKFSDSFESMAVLLLEYCPSDSKPLWNSKEFRQFTNKAEFLWRLHHLDINRKTDQGFLRGISRQDGEQMVDGSDIKDDLIKRVKKFLERSHPLFLKDEEYPCHTQQFFMICWVFVDTYLKSITKGGAPYGSEAPIEKETKVRIDLQNKKNAFDSLFLRYAVVHPDSPRVASWLCLQGDQVGRSDILINYAEESLVLRCVNRWRAYLLACPDISLENSLSGNLLKELTLSEPERALWAFNSKLAQKLEELEKRASVVSADASDTLTKAFAHLKAQGPNNVIAEIQSEIRSLHRYLFKPENKSVPIEEFSGFVEKQDYICDLILHGALPEAIIELRALQTYYCREKPAEFDPKIEMLWLKLKPTITNQLKILSDEESISSDKNQSAIKNLKEIFNILQDNFLSQCPTVVEQIVEMNQQLDDLEKSAVLQGQLSENLKMLQSFISSSDKAWKMMTFDVKNLPRFFHLSQKQSDSCTELLRKLENETAKKGVKTKEEATKALEEINTLITLGKGSEKKISLSIQIEKAQGALNTFFNHIVLKHVEDSLQTHFGEDLQKIQNGSDCKDSGDIWRKIQKKLECLDVEGIDDVIYDRLQNELILALFQRINQLKDQIISCDDLSKQLKEIIGKIEAFPKRPTNLLANRRDSVYSDKLIKIRANLEKAVNSLEAVGSLNLQYQTLQEVTIKLKALFLAYSQENLTSTAKNLAESDLEVFWSNLQPEITCRLKALSLQKDMLSPENKSEIENLKKLFAVFQENSLSQSLIAAPQVAQMKQQLDNLERSALLFQWVITTLDFFLSRAFNQDLMPRFDAIENLPKVFYLSKVQSEVFEKLLNKLAKQTGVLDRVKLLSSSLRAIIKLGRTFDGTSMQETDLLNEHVFQAQRMSGDLSNYILLQQAEKILRTNLEEGEKYLRELPERYPAIIEAICKQLRLEKVEGGKYPDFDSVWRELRKSEEKEIVEFKTWFNKCAEDKKLPIEQTLYLFAQLSWLKDPTNTELNPTLYLLNLIKAQIKVLESRTLEWQKLLDEANNPNDNLEIDTDDNQKESDYLGMLFEIREALEKIVPPSVSHIPSKEGGGNSKEGAIIPVVQIAKTPSTSPDDVRYPYSHGRNYSSSRALFLPPAQDKRSMEVVEIRPTLTP